MKQFTKEKNIRGITPRIILLVCWFDVRSKTILGIALPGQHDASPEPTIPKLSVTAHYIAVT
jgi:hypothetical protein